MNRSVAHPLPGRLRWSTLLALSVVALVLLVAPGPVSLVAAAPAPAIGSVGTPPTGPTPATVAPTAWPASASDLALPTVALALPALLTPAPFAGADPTLPAAGPIEPADAANPDLANYSSTTSVAAPGPSPAYAVVGASDDSTYYFDQPYFWTHGFDAVFATQDGGSTWSTSYLGQNSSWASSSSPTYADLDFGEPSLAGANGTVLYAAVYAQPCAVDTSLTCNNTIEYYGAPNGVSVARSTDSGLTWGAPVPVNAQPWWTLFSFFCGTSSYTYYIEGGNISDKPSVAYSAASNTAVVGWDVLHYGGPVAICSGNSFTGLEFTSETIIVEVAVSHNGGISWGAPTIIGDVAASLPTVAIGPPPTNTLSVAYADFVNGTASTYPIAYSSSSNGGTTWSAPTDVGGASLVAPVNSSAIDFPTALTDPVMTVDNSSGSPYAGSVYLVWDQNRSGVASVALVRSANGGGSWTSASYPASGNATRQYLEPSVTVVPGGGVWVVEYGQNRITHAYQLYGEYSTDGANSWTQPFPISDTPGTPGSGTGSLGTWTGVAATPSGVYTAWTDCRWKACASEGETAVYAAHVEPVTVTASEAGVSATVVTADSNVTTPTPFATGWDLGSLVRLNATPWVPETNTTDFVAQFHNFTGIVNATANPVEFDVGGGTSVEANYQPSPAGWIAGTVSPASADPVVTVDGTPVALTTYNATALAFNVTEASNGQYTVTANAVGYHGTSESLPTNAFRTTDVAFTLTRTAGWIRGTLTPATAQLTVNNSLVTDVNSGTGAFNVTEPWGWYWLNASSPGLTSFSEYVSVAPGVTTIVAPRLDASWIAGTVTPGNATVRVNGVAEPVAGGLFNVTVPGGTYTVTASLPNYDSFRTVVTLAPGTGSVLAIALTDVGWIRGTVDPVTASVLVDGVAVGLVGGVFNDPVTGNATYNVTVTAHGFRTAWSDVPVAPANASYANFSLVALTPTCTVSCGTQPGSGSNRSEGSSAAAYTLLDVVVAAVVLLGLAALGALLLLRRREGPPPSDEPAEAVPAASPPPGSSSPGEPADEMIYGEDRSAPEPWSEGSDPSQGLQPPR